MDQRRCCILGLCCPPGSAEQAQAMADLLAEEGYKGTEEAILRHAKNILHKLGLDQAPLPWAAQEAAA